MRHPTPDALARFTDGLARPSEARTVSEHLAVCAQCCQILQTCRGVEALLREDPIDPPDGYFEALPERIVRRLGSLELEPRRGSGRVWRRPRAAVFGSLLAVAATAAFLAVLSPWTLRRAAEIAPLSSAADGSSRRKGDVAHFPAEPEGLAAVPKPKGRGGSPRVGADERKAGSPAPRGARLGPEARPERQAQANRAETGSPRAPAPAAVAPQLEGAEVPSDAAGLPGPLPEREAITALAKGDGVSVAERWRARARELERRADSASDALLSDDARLAACEAWLEAFESEGVEDDRLAGLRGALGYLERADARQRERALRLLARLRAPKDR